MPGYQSFDKEKIHINVARLKKGGTTFEIVIDPELALQYKKGNVDIRDVLKSEHIFEDPKKGLKASEAALKAVFNTADALEVAKIILDQGEIQFTAEHREKEVEEKRKKIINIIHTNAIDPKTGLPHPSERISNALDEAKVHIQDKKNAEEQIDEIVKKIRIILPLKFAVSEIELLIPASYAPKIYGTVKNYGKLLKENWMNDGSLLAHVEIPAGLKLELIDVLNEKTHGNVTVKIIRED
ncbi:ribosome assembly factor SBDS [Candidatus Woesearchaeota archaeon]|nr:MAG: ribosome assembly factor SBDS [Candidatus Woesearchaeota archaeon]